MTKLTLDCVVVGDIENPQGHSVFGHHPDEPGGGIWNRQVLDVVTADVTVNNTADETTIYSFTVPGGSLGTNNLLMLTLEVAYLNNSGAPQTLRWVVYYGADKTIDIVSYPVATAGTWHAYDYKIYLKGHGAVGEQRVLSRPWFTGVPSATGEASIGGHEDCYTDSTKDQDLVVKVQHSAADPELTLLCRAAILELMKAF